MEPPRKKFDEHTDVQGEPFGYPSAMLRSIPSVTWTDARGSHTEPVAGRKVLGSAAEVDLVVADPSVSRLHAELELQDDGLWVHDLSSRNGTFVEGVQVRSARVPAAGKVRVGSTTLLVRYAPNGTPVELWPTD